MTHPFRVLFRSIVLLTLTTTAAHSQDFKIIDTFTAASLNEYPESGLVADAAGNLYGTASGGGQNGGSVFELTPPADSQGAWTEQVIYSFGSSAHYSPRGGLVFDNAGNLYGTTEEGGSSGVGTVFQLSPPSTQGELWTHTTLLNFNVTNGAYPLATLLLDNAGNLYGTTQQGGVLNLTNCVGYPEGCGLVFELSPPATQGGTWTETILHKFQGGNEGFGSFSTLIFDAKGNLYGTTVYGGAGAGTEGFGTVFRLKPPSSQGGAWTEQILYRFTGGSSDGEFPIAGVVIGKNGNLFGTTFQGGANDEGTAFEIFPPGKGDTWTEQVIHDFALPPSDGYWPDGALIIDRAGNLYGVTGHGGADQGCGGEFAACGVVFQLTPPASMTGTWTETVIHNFNGKGGGGWPVDNLIFDKWGNLYGVASSGGDLSCQSGGCGAVFTLAP